MSWGLNHNSQQNRMVNKDFRKWENAQQTSPRALLYDAATYEFIYSFIPS